MPHPNIAVVTGAFSYTGRYVIRHPLDQGVLVRTLTRSPDAEDPFGGRVEVAPLDGLSPRLRGNPGLMFSGSLPAGSIPAPAGEPRPDVLGVTPRRVYPRACGGTPNAVGAGLHVCGLSPRLRGNPSPAFDVKLAGGSIPAPAGEPGPVR